MRKTGRYFLFYNNSKEITRILENDSRRIISSNFMRKTLKFSDQMSQNDSLTENLNLKKVTKNESQTNQGSENESIEKSDT